MSVPAAQPKPPTQHLDMLDIVRGLAAMLTYIAHYFMMYPGGSPPEISGLSSVVWRHFPKGVPLFFALSGLSLFLGYFPRRHEPAMLREFFVRRFFRIAPLFYLALGISIAILWHRGGAVTGGELLANVTLTFGLFPGIHKSLVDAGWSVGVEVLFYLVFPLLLTWVVNQGRSVVLWMVASVVAVVAYVYLRRLLPGLYYAEMSALIYAHFFATGIVVYFFYEAWKHRGRPNERIIAWAGPGVAIATILVLILGGPVRIPFVTAVGAKIILWALPMGFLLLAACTVSTPWRWLRPLVWLGKCSYSVYLLHPLILIFACGFIHPVAPPTSTDLGRFSGVFALTTALLLVVSGLSYRYFERPFMQLARRLTARDQAQ
ncbi:MAG: acyltransferase [Opitutaceae bacterium]